MLEKFQNIFRVPELRKRIFFTFAMLIVFRLGAHITIPGVDVKALADFFSASQGGLLSFIDIFSGGALKRFTLFALGIMPYISSSIILQLLIVVIPYLEKLSKEGEAGRKKINQYTRYGTVLLCVIQGSALTIWLKGITSNGIPIVPHPTIGFTFIAVLAMTTGTIFLMWLGEKITENGIGNGISILIFAGIIVRVPAGIKQAVDATKMGELNPVILILLGVLFIVVTAISILLIQGQRRIPLQYGKKIVGRRVMQMKANSIPLRINQAGVIPIIFASSIMMFPAQIGNFIGKKGLNFKLLDYIITLFQPGNVLYLIFYALLIIFFAYYYTAIQFNPADVAENLRKYGGFIPGIRPGKNTAEYIENVMNRITISGALILAFIAVFPTILNKMWHIPYATASLFGGTSLLIIIGVDIETMKQIESHLLMRHYSGFMSKGKMRGR